jgi:hypothetical protein
MAEQLTSGLAKLGLDNLSFNILLRNFTLVPA